MEKLSVKGLALALGLTWAIAMLFTGWAAAFGWAAKFVEVMSSIYIGFEPGFVGGLIGAVWGFVDGAIGGAIIAAAYNAVAGRK